MSEEEAINESTYPRFLLDFLYVDVARLRSYLAQLAGGVPTTAVEALEQVATRSAEASVPVGRGGRTSGTSERWETTRALGDLIVTAFEEEASAAGYLVDITGDFDDPAAWYRGEAYNRLPVGTIFRYTCSARLFDPEHVAKLIEQFEGASQAFGRLVSGGGQGRESTTSGRVTPRGGGGSGSQADQLRRLKKFTEPIRDVISNLLSGGIFLRLFPCGVDHPDCGFGGILLDRSDYIEPERAALFARHGIAVSEWTVVGVVTRLPERQQGTNLTPVDPATLVRPSGGINRQGLEGVVLQLLEAMEGLGMSEGPAWPSIAMTPLAVYRTIQRVRS